MKKDMKLKDIAAMLGVSPSAVSIVLNGRSGVSEETRASISKVLKLYGYELKSAHNAERQKSSAAPVKTIRFLKYNNSAILVEENGNFVSSIIDSLEEECRKLGYHLLITSFGPEHKDEIFHMVYDEPMDGVIVLGTELEEEDLPFFEAFPVPVVLVDTPAPSRPLNCVTMNNIEIVEKAVRHMYHLGHRRIGYLHSSIDTGNFIARQRGFINSLQEWHLDPDTSPIFRITPSLTGSYREMLSLLDSGTILPPALVADNDMIALGCSRALKERGYVLPQDCSIVGIDDIPYSAICAPPLTSVHIPCRELGIQTVQLLHYKLENPLTPPTKILVEGTLAMRGSVCPAVPPENGEADSFGVNTECAQ